MAQQGLGTVDRQKTTPFLLRLFFKQGAFPRLDDFDPALSRLPQHVQVYTWQNCTLRELCTLLLSALPAQLPRPYVGARISFRLVYPDPRGMDRQDAHGRFISRDIGSVIVGARTRNDDFRMEDADYNVEEALKQLDGDPNRSLGDARFQIGDYVACAILPPLPDGGVPPALHGPSRGGIPPYGGRGRENGFGSRGDYGSGRGRGGSRYEDRRPNGGVPSGEWRRGEAPPDREPASNFSRGGRGGDGGNWRGRGRGRW